MKKRYLLIYLFLVLGVFCGHGQTITSTESHYYSMRGNTDPIVCTNPNDNNNAIICFSDSTTRNPCFIYHNHSVSGTSRKCLWPTSATPYGFTHYLVRDMTVIGDKCYFCGTKTSDTGAVYTIQGYLMILSETTGFFGWFDLAQIANPSATSLNLHLFNIPVVPPKRMAGIVENGVTKLGFINETTLALVKGDGYSWSNVVEPLALGTEELVDITFTANHLVTLSRFSGESFSFGLRSEPISDAFFFIHPDPQSNYYHGVKFNTAPMTTLSLPEQYPTMQPTDVTMRMASHPGSDFLTVAYDGKKYDEGDCSHFGFYTPMFLMDLSGCHPGHVDIAMSEAMLVTNPLLKLSSYSLQDMGYLPLGNTYAIALLHGMDYENYGLWSILQTPSWIQYGDLQGVQADNRGFKSMDVDGNGWIHLAGWLQADRKLLQSRQDGNHMERSCDATRPVAFTEALKPLVEGTDVLITPPGIPFHIISQEQHSVDMTGTGYYIKCTTAY